MPLDFQPHDEARYVVVRPSGRLTVAEYSELTGRFEAFLDLHGRGSMVEVLDGFQGVDRRTLVPGLRFRWKNFPRIDRLAVVGGSGAARLGLRILAPFVPPDLRAYRATELGRATRWVAGVEGDLSSPSPPAGSAPPPAAPR
jgi:hypothetical protein